MKIFYAVIYQKINWKYNTYTHHPDKSMEQLSSKTASSTSYNSVLSHISIDFSFPNQ